MIQTSIGYVCRLFLFLSLIIELAACSPMYRVKGKVTRCDTQAPIQDATIHLDFKGYNDQKEHGETRSDAQGDFIVAANTPPWAAPKVGVKLSVSADGFTSIEHPVNSSQAHQTVCLESR